MRNNYCYLVMLLFVSSIHAYKGECCVDAALLRATRSIQNTTNTILGKVCTILEKVCDIQECTPVPITQPLTITQSGSYCLATSLQAAGAGSDPLIIIDADIVSLDFASHSLDANGADHALSITGHSKVVIFNGCVENAASSGIVVSNGNQVTVGDMKFQANANGILVADSSCEVSIINSAFRETTPGSAIVCENSQNIRISNSTLCENTGANGILVSTCSGVLIDPTLIIANDFTGTAAGVLLNNTGDTVIRELQIDSNTGTIGFIGVWGVNSNQVEISDSVIRNCSAPNIVRGFDAGLMQPGIGWVFNNCTVSNITLLQSGVVQGFVSGNSAFFNNCVVTNILTDTVDSQVDCYLLGRGVRVANCLAADCLVDGNSPTEPAGSFLNGFRVTDNGNELLNNSALDLIVSTTVNNSAAYNLATATVGRINENNATNNTGMAGFLADTTAGNSFFENQASNNTISGSNANYRVVAGALPVVRTFNVSTGTFAVTPEPFDNIQIVA